MICIFILKSDMYDSLLKMGTLSVHLKIYFKNEYNSGVNLTLPWKSNMKYCWQLNVQSHIDRIA